MRSSDQAEQQSPDQVRALRLSLIGPIRPIGAPGAQARTLHAASLARSAAGTLSGQSNQSP
jgi:hypothetical protein